MYIFHSTLEMHIFVFGHDVDGNPQYFPLSGAFSYISSSFFRFFEMLKRHAFFVEMCILYTRNIMNVTKWGDRGR